MPSPTTSCMSLKEGDGKSFTQKGTKMLLIVFLAGREANRQAGKEGRPDYAVCRLHSGPGFEPHRQTPL